MPVDHQPELSAGAVRKPAIRINAVTTVAYVDGVAVITIDSPPVNALSADVRGGLFHGVRQGLADDDVSAIVLRCAGRTFIAGADIREIGRPKEPPTLAEVQETIESAAKPVIAALHGSVLGGGLEVALCAHFRLATRSTRLGLPEVKLGLLAGAGGTQRLTRLVGPAPALDMMTTGREVMAAEAHGLGLIDAIAHSDLVEAAVTFARRVAAEGRPLRRIRKEDGRIALEDPDAFFREFRSSSAALRDGQRAPEAIVQCVEAAVSLPWPCAIEVERQLFRELAATSESAALRYAFLAERQSRRQPSAARSSRPANITCLSLLRGGPLLDELTAELPAHILATGASAGGCAAILLDGWSDAVPDGGGRPVINIAPASEASIGDPASGTRSGADFAFFVSRPGAGGRLIEIRARPERPAEWREIALEVAREMKATPVFVGPGPGLPSSRLVRRTEGLFKRMAEGGVSPGTIHTAMSRFGFREGPLLPAAPPSPVNSSPIEDESILILVVAALADEAARLIEDGHVSRGCEIDMIALAGLAWPRHRGGPLWQGDQWGSGRLLSILADTARVQGRAYQPPRLLLECAAGNGRLADFAL
jgi:3-hydroxyacyl-CoA dehydrogenase